MARRRALCTMTALVIGALAAALATQAPGLALDAGHSADAGHRAGTAIVLGQASAPLGGCGFVGYTYVQQDVTGTSFVTPSAGVITSVSYFANSTAGNIRVVLLRPSATMAGHFESIGYGAPLAVAPNVLNTFPTRIRIGSGVTLALYTDTATMACVSTAPMGDSIRYGAFDPTTGSDYNPPSNLDNVQVDLAATLESDGDGDGYGDVTQDQCPTSDLTHGSCDNVIEPNTGFGQKPAKRGAKRKIRATFTSTVPGSTFECSLDRRPMRPCPARYKKRVGYGRHVLKVQAVGPAGLVDQTPASVAFRVVRPRH